MLTPEDLELINAFVALSPEQRAASIAFLTAVENEKLSKQPNSFDGTLQTARPSSA